MINDIVKCEDRLQNLTNIDSGVCNKIEKVIKAEVYALLKDYFDIDPNNLQVDLFVNSSNNYVLSINAIATNIKIARMLR